MLGNILVYLRNDVDIDGQKYCNSGQEQDEGLREVGLGQRNKAQIRHIFLDGYDVLDVRIVIFKISLFKLQNACLLVNLHQVEFFEGWKPLSPLQLAVEEVMSE
ncbi:hypothetical protein Tco_1467584 [Tanacetum coccineum]